MSASAEEVRRRKRALRQRAVDLALPAWPEGAVRHASVCRRLGRVIAEVQPRRVALYGALPREVSLGELLEELWDSGLCTVFPRIAGDHLELREVSRCGELVPGRLGIPEPGSERPLCAPDRVDLFAVPGLLFDRRGRRLGRGRGYYDRLLARARSEAPRVGVCFAEQLAESLPVAPWDQRMSHVVTDRECIRTPEDGRAPGRACP